MIFIGLMELILDIINSCRFVIDKLQKTNFWNSDHVKFWIASFCGVVVVVTYTCKKFLWCQNVKCQIRQSYSRYMPLLCFPKSSFQQPWLVKRHEKSFNVLSKVGCFIQSWMFYPKLIVLPKVGCFIQRWIFHQKFFSYL